MKTNEGSHAALRLLIFCIDNGFRPSLDDMRMCVDLLRPLIKESKKRGPKLRATLTMDRPLTGRCTLMAWRVNKQVSNKIKPWPACKAVGDQMGASPHTVHRAWETFGASIAELERLVLENKFIDFSELWAHFERDPSFVLKNVQMIWQNFKE